MSAGLYDKLTGGKNIYQIEIFRTVQVNITTSEENTHIELKNVALVTDYIANLVSLHLLN
jgi:hypothetical protein